MGTQRYAPAFSLALEATSTTLPQPITAFSLIWNFSSICDHPAPTPIPTRFPLVKKSDHHAYCSTRLSGDVGPSSPRDIRVQTVYQTNAMNMYPSNTSIYVAYTPSHMAPITCSRNHIQTGLHVMHVRICSVLDAESKLENVLYMTVILPVVGRFRPTPHTDHLRGTDSHCCVSV